MKTGHTGKLETIHPPPPGKVQISGILLSLCLFLCNYLVFGNLIKPRMHSASPLGEQMASAGSPTYPAFSTTLNSKTLSEFKKREHVRTLVLQNFPEISLPERTKLFEVIYNQSLALGIDPYLTLSVIATESSFRQEAISWAGAYGLMQIKLITAEEVAAELGIPWKGEQTLFDPVVNITLGLRYLANMKERFGNMSDALTAYNYGPQYVVSCFSSGKRLPDKYIKKIAGHLQRYGVPASGFIYPENRA